MFTSVDSNRKKLEHPSNENVQFPQSLDNSVIKESKSGIANQIETIKVIPKIVNCNFVYSSFWESK